VAAAAAPGPPHRAPGDLTEGRILVVEQTGEGLRPVALAAEAEMHPLDGERAVQLGLMLNEAVTNALNYAFPEERAGAVRVRSAREGGAFVLTVADDGIGLPRDRGRRCPARRGQGRPEGHDGYRHGSRARCAARRGWSHPLTSA
jgi:anti-sigma regulatory factor (Ser/Thr protein kinase)